MNPQGWHVLKRGLCGFAAGWRAAVRKDCPRYPILEET